jgi:serine/threonine protein kinase
LQGKLFNGLDIAVKRHERSSYQGPAEFRAEIELIQNLRHKNIITLHGYCVQQEEKILVYEYMQNKSLACIIAGKFILRSGLLPLLFFWSFSAST